MKQKEEHMSRFIAKRLEERRNGEKETIRLNKDVSKSASMFISRRMDGVYQKDEEILDIFATEVEGLFAPEIQVLQPKFSEQVLTMVREF